VEGGSLLKKRKPQKTRKEKKKKRREKTLWKLQTREVVVPELSVH
jgi:hypothetical protein